MKKVSFILAILLIPIFPIIGFWIIFHTPDIIVSGGTEYRFVVYPFSLTSLLFILLRVIGTLIAGWTIYLVLQLSKKKTSFTLKDFV